MNEQQLIDIIEMIDADKSLSQPWKNYALSDARRALASLKMANASLSRFHELTSQKRLDGLKINDSTNSVEECICKPGALNSLCIAERHNS